MSLPLECILPRSEINNGSLFEEFSRLLSSPLLRQKVENGQKLQPRRGKNTRIYASCTSQEKRWIFTERGAQRGQSWLNLRKPDVALINHFNHGTGSKTDGAVPSNLCRSSFSNFSLETGRVGEKLIGGRGRIFVSGKDFAGLRVYRAASGRNYFSSDRGESFHGDKLFFPSSLQDSFIYFHDVVAPRSSRIPFLIPPSPSFPSLLATLNRAFSLSRNDKGSRNIRRHARLKRVYYSSCPRLREGRKEQNGCVSTFDERGPVFTTLLLGNL